MKRKDAVVHMKPELDRKGEVNKNLLVDRKNQLAATDNNNTLNLAVPHLCTGVMRLQSTSINPARHSIAPPLEPGLIGNITQIQQCILYATSQVGDIGAREGYTVIGEMA